MSRLRVLFSTLACIAIPQLASAQAQFTAKMAGSQQVPAVVTAARGSAHLTLTSAGVQFLVTAEGLSGPITAAHIHRGAQGNNGPVVRELVFDGHTTRGLWSAADAQPLTASLIGDLTNSDLYVNVHTAANPTGEIRGQIELSAGVHFTVSLDGGEENPPIATAGTATSSLTLTGEGLAFRISADGLSGAITTAHIHRGAIGVNGPVQVDLTTFFTGSNAVGAVTLSPALRRDLIAGNLYLNLHTAANSGGEVRGQIHLDDGFGLSAHLDQAQQVPPTGSPAIGSVVFTLTPEGLQLDITATGLSGAINAAHIHRGAAGVNGPAVRTLTADFSGNTASALWRADDAEPLTPALIADLLGDGLYVNLHTAANPTGEIRGQIRLNHPAATTVGTFLANMTGDQNEPPVVLPASGTAAFRLTPAGLEYDITVNGLTGAITMAHFHEAPIGASGGIRRDLVFTGGSAQGIWTAGDPQPLTAALITSLYKGTLYVNVHTAAFGAGEIRGQIVPASGAGMRARMTGAQQVPPLAVAGLGTASFSLTPDGLAYAITVNGLSGAVNAAHIHRGAPGANGPVVRDLLADFIGNTATGVWKLTDAQPLTAALVTELLTGNLYVNVHTAANPTGEIRGQIVLAGGDGRAASLSAGQQTEPVQSVGSGVASMTVTDQGLVFRISINDLVGTFTQAHFHNGAWQTNGPIARFISEFVNLTGDGVWKPSDGDAFSATRYGQIQREEMYIDAHTTSYPDGEIRGQIGARTIAAVEPPDPSQVIALSSRPNPASSRAVISFRLPQAGAVDLAVYDLGGRRVAQVTREALGAGTYHRRFSTAGLAPGLYMIRMRSGATEQIGKLVIVK